MYEARTWQQQGRAVVHTGASSDQLVQRRVKELLQRVVWSQRYQGRICWA